MKNAEERSPVVARLRGDVLTHIVTLKMLRLYGDSMQVYLVEDETGWASLSLLPVQVSDFDRQTYPDADFVVLVDGTSGMAKSLLLEKLPPGCLVIKSSDATVKAFAADRLGAKKVRSFKSFTQPAGVGPTAVVAGVKESDVLSPEIERMISGQGSLSSELADHFAEGARWFALDDSGRPVSACFVFRNFDNVWEVAGVYTEGQHRRQGLARKVVTAALAYLAGRKLIPRYQVRSDNVESAQLALSVGLREFIQIDHWVADSRRR